MDGNQIFYHHTTPNVLPSSSIDSNVSMEWKQRKCKELGTHSLAHSTLGVEGCAGALKWD